jgi:hypothetical protein
MPEHIHKKSAPASPSRRMIALVLGAATLFGPLSIPRAAETDVAVDNLVFAIGATTYRIPHLELKGATLSAGELAELFKGDEPAIDGRLARLSARSLVLPSMTAETRTGDSVERATYRDLRAESVAAGRIGVLRIAGAEQTNEASDGASRRYLWGASLLKGVDLRQLVHLRLATRVDPGETLKPVIDEERVESLVLEDPARKLTVKTGALVLAGVKGRAFSSPPARILDSLEKPDPGKSAADPALLAFLVDALASLDVASVEAKDLSVSGKGEPAEKPYSVSIGRFAANKIAGAVVGELKMEDFSLAASDGGKISLERVGLRDASLASLVEGAYPRLGHFEAKGLAADLPDVGAEDSARMKFGLAGVEADFADFREIAPAKLSARMDRLASDLAARGETASTAQFLALGYRSLDLSAAFAGEWNEKTREAIFAPIRFEGRDMVTATLKATFGNVSSAVFSAMPLVSKAAALAASVKSVDLALDGGGLVDRLLAFEAKEQKAPIEKARAEYAKAAALLVADFCGGGEKAKKIAEAVSAYILKPKRLHLRLASEKGVGAMDALARKPGEILESVEVEASAEK